jgi:DsbC/DsbD-like thiol-disulfide interchange protein
VGDSAHRVLRAGVELKLLPGWKTYWRYPGDSGVPPAFDFTASENVKTVAVLYPAPQRFPDGGGGQSLGYKGDIVLPLHVVPKDASKPVTLRMKLDYAVCEKLCVPAKAKAELALSGNASGEEAAVASAETGVPKPGAIGDGKPLSIRAVRLESTSSKPRLVVDVASAIGTTIDLFAEGPTPEWALPLPQLISGAPAGTQRFAFEIDGMPPGVKPDGAELRLTAVSGGQAVEALFRLD